MSGPTLDINLLVHNGAATLGATIESILAQTRGDFRLTILDNHSDDGTEEIARSYGAQDARVTLHRHPANIGGLRNCERAFTVGDAPFVLPKTADDLLAPEFVEQIMEVMQAAPDCAMCHAAGLVFTGTGRVQGMYPLSHRLHAVGAAMRVRAGIVMRHYTSAPSFWGIYRRTAAARLSRFRYRAGWDHAALAELALFGEIRHVPEVLFWRRDGGRPLALLARLQTEASQNGASIDDALSDATWRMPLLTTAYCHLETFSIQPLFVRDRTALMEDAVRIFRARWLGPMRQEAAALRAALPGLYAMAEASPLRIWAMARIAEALTIAGTLLPEEAFPVSPYAFETSRATCGRAPAAAR